MLERAIKELEPEGDHIVGMDLLYQISDGSRHPTVFGQERHDQNGGYVQDLTGRKPPRWCPPKQ